MASKHDEIREQALASTDRILGPDPKAFGRLAAHIAREQAIEEAQQKTGATIAAGRPVFNVPGHGELTEDQLLDLASRSRG